MRNSAWRQLASTARYECILILRDPAFRGLFVLCQLALALYVLHYGLDRPIEPLLADLVSSFGLVLAVVISVYTVHSLRRARLEGVDETLAGLPTRPAPELWGKVLAASLAGAGLVAEPLLLGMALGWGRPELPGLLLYHGAFLVANLGLAVASAVLAAVLLGRSNLGYAAAPAAWVGSGFACNYLVYGLGFTRASLGLSFAAGVGYHRTDSLWGAWPDLPLALPQYAFVTAASVALVAVAILASAGGREPGRPRWRTTAVLLLAVALALPAGRLYLHRLDARLASIDRQVELERAAAGAAALPVPGVVRVTGYEVTVWLERDGTLRAEAVLEVVNGGAEPLAALPLILNGVFEVESAAAGGVEVSFQARGHRLDLDLPRPLEPSAGCWVYLRYRGTPGTWNRRGLAGPHLVAGTWGRGTLLPAGFAWYPLPGQAGAFAFDRRQPATLTPPVFWGFGPPGHHDPRAVVTGLSFVPHYLEAVPFALTVHAPPGQVLESNLALRERAEGVTRFSGLAENGCYLLGAPDAVGLTTAGGLKVVGAGECSDHLQALAAHAEAALALMRTLAGEHPSAPPTITVLSRAGAPEWLGPALGGSLNLDVNQAGLVASPAGPGGPSRLAQLEGVFAWAFGRTLDWLDFGVEDSFEPAMIREACQELLRALFLGRTYGDDFYLAAREAARARSILPNHPWRPEGGNPGLEREQYHQAVEALFGYVDRYGPEAALSLGAYLYPAIRAGSLDLAGLLRAVGEGGS
ncbi:MAG: hypothetical protein RDU89_02775 [bacterium]|nr:hypothetical protein [bacterium]